MSMEKSVIAEPKTAIITRAVDGQKYVIEYPSSEESFIIDDCIRADEVGNISSYDVDACIPDGFVKSENEDDISVVITCIGYRATLLCELPEVTPPQKTKQQKFKASCIAVAIKQEIEAEIEFKKYQTESEITYQQDAITQMTALLVQKYHDLKKVLAENGVFFAFSKKQFEEGKTALNDDDAYISIGGGGYMPKSKYDILISAVDAQSEWFDRQIKAHGLEETEIEYELGNHECYYTGSIEDAMDALGDKYTREQVLSVYRKNRDSHNDDCGVAIN